MEGSSVENGEFEEKEQTKMAQRKKKPTILTFASFSVVVNCRRDE